MVLVLYSHSISMRRLTRHDRPTSGFARASVLWMLAFDVRSSITTLPMVRAHATHIARSTCTFSTGSLDSSIACAGTTRYATSYRVTKTACCQHRTITFRRVKNASCTRIRRSVGHSSTASSPRVGANWTRALEICLAHRQKACNYIEMYAAFVFQRWIRRQVFTD
jgi:hypothetical protein